MKTAFLSTTPISDISVLAGMPLEVVALNRTYVTDVAPLLRCPTLKDIVVPELSHGIGELRGPPALKRISFQNNRDTASQPAKEFWERWDVEMILCPAIVAGRRERIAEAAVTIPFRVLVLPMASLPRA